MREFAELLREDTDGYDGLYADLIRWTPALFEFLSALAEDTRLSRDGRIWINAALAYFVLPFDVIPETGMGGYGYLDDLYLTAKVIHSLQMRPDQAELLDDHWAHDKALPVLVAELLAKGGEALGEDDCREIMRLAGLGR